MRIGFGYDVHGFEEGKPFILGGVEIPFEKGLLGHSDADVLTHAVIDALFGAAALGDIGKHFPDTDERYKGISSIILLNKCVDELKERGYRVINVDSTKASAFRIRRRYKREPRPQFGHFCLLRVGKSKNRRGTRVYGSGTRR